MGDINYLGGIPLGKVNEFQNSKQSSLTPIPFPGQDSDLTEAVDTLGVIKYMTLRGRFVGPYEEIQNRIWLIQDIIDGYQFESSTLYSPFVSGVFVTGFKPVVREKRQGVISTITGVGTSTITDSTLLTSFTLRGIQLNRDIIKNLQTGNTTTVTGVSGNTLTLNTQIFTVTGQPYAVTANINVKVLKFESLWQLPGLSWCDYTLELMQVR